MRFNNRMKALLQTCLTEPMDSILADNAYPIWQKKDTGGRVYWGVSNFWGMDQTPVLPDRDLSQMEWDGNEVHLDAPTKEAIPQMLRKTVGILKYWRQELEAQYPDTAFCLFAAYDDGSLLILEEGEEPISSMTLRFWADRGENTVIDLSDFDDWDQPAVLMYCNPQKQ